MRKFIIKLFVNTSLVVAVAGAFTTAIMFLAGVEGDLPGRVFCVTLFAFVAGTFPLSSLE